MNINERFEQAIEKLNKDHLYLASEITKMGYPKVDKSIPTAGVLWDDKKNRINFLFNPDFAKKLNDEQFCHTILHEVMHIVNCHIFLMRDELNRLKNSGKKNKMYKFKHKMNVAMDCVVNDSLLYWYKFPKVFDEKSEIKLCYGMDILKTNCHDMTAEEVYYMLPEDMFKDFDCMHMSWDSFFDENGNLKKKFADKIKGFISNNKMNSNLSDEEMAEIERMKEKFKECKDQNAGNIPIGNLRSVADVNKYLKWDQILSEFVEIRKIEETWARVDKKLYSFYPDTILPSSKDAEKQEIFVAIDASGSIDYNALSLFTSLLKSIPNHIKITAISFDTQCYEYDIFGNERPKGSGGTSFNIIEDHLQKNLKKYPKCVIVMTDGKGNDINPQYKNRWLWLLYGSSSNAYCKDMKHYELERFIK